MLVGSGGVGGVDGVYPLAGVSGNQFTLGTRICSLPAAVTSGSAFLGKLRWPLAPAIRGRVAITLAVPGNTGDPHDTLIFVDGDTMLRTGDQVVVSGCGLTSANGTWTITRLTDNSFYLNGSSTFAANATGGWVAGFNSANYIWDNNQSRGDWCLMSWVYNFRDVGEANRLHGIYLEFINPEIHCGTIADVPIPRPGPLVVAPVEQHGSDPLYCCRTIVMISPNPERRPEGTNWVLPRLTCDERYTTLGQIIPKQWMVDPLWQAPPAPCFQEDKDEWLEDDGNGLFDHEEVDPISGEPYMVRYYPQRPWEEARAYTPRPPTDPPGCPDLPPGTYLVMGSDNAPNPGTCWFAPWVIFLAEQANIQSSKRFHCEYADPQAECPGDDFVEDTP